MPPILTVKLLGQVTVCVDDEPVADLPTQKAVALLVYLIANQRPYAREFLAELLWEDRDRRQGLANLRSLLSGLRRRLKPFLIITRQTVAFNQESNYQLDTAQFVTAVSPLLREYETEKKLPPAAAQTLREALALYGGEFLTGFFIRESRGFDEWATLQRERFQRLAIMGLRLLVRHELATGNYAQGLVQAEKLVSFDPLSEEAHRQMMLLLARTGQRNAALAHFARCRQLLKKELGVSPSSQTVAVYERIQAVGSEPLHNLPPDPSSFVGRESELVEIRQQLVNPDCRLLTLLGPGGVGKTRLAVQVAREIINESAGTFLHGICYVPLADLSSGRFFTTAIADALDLKAQGSRELREQLIDYLSERETLLILDNFEHLLSLDDEALEVLNMLLQEAPFVKFLVTTRERLGMYEERLFDLHGLRYPQEDVEEAAAYSAVQLFLQRAHRLWRHFQPTGKDFAAITRICRLLDGLPLGIELAAGWIRQMDCAAIAAQIEESRDLSFKAIHNLPSRHRSLRAVFEHSWSLLTAGEQGVLRRLGIFYGSFSAEAAEAVTEATLSHLSALEDKSLLRRMTNGRYQLHPVIRQFVVEQLEQAPEERAQRQRAFIDYYTSFLQNQEAALNGEKHNEARALVLTELDNVRAAWRLAALSTDVAAIDRALEALFYFYQRQSWFQEGEALLEPVAERLAKSTSEDKQLLLARLLVRQARLGIYLGQYEKSQDLLQEGLRLLESQDAAVEEGTALAYLGVLAASQGRYDEAERFGTKSLAILRRVEDPASIAYCLNLLGNVAQKQGDYERARTLQQEHLAIRRELNDTFSAGLALNNLGNIAQAMADYKEAKRLYQLAYDIFRQEKYQLGMAVTQTNSGYVAWQLGNYEEARQLHLESLRIKQGMDDKRGTAISLTNLGEVATSAGDYDAALDYFRKGLAIAVAHDLQGTTVELLTGVAALMLRMGEPEQALSLLVAVSKASASSVEVLDRVADLLDEAATLLSPEKIDAAKQNGATLSCAELGTRLVRELEMGAAA